MKRTQSSENQEKLKVPAAAAAAAAVGSSSSSPSNGIPCYWPSPPQFPIPPVAAASGIRSGRATPLVFLPVPFLLPFVAFQCGKHPSQESPTKKDHRPDSQKKVGEAATTSTPLVTNCGSPSGSGCCQRRGEEDSVHNISAAATEARWRRRELMKMRHHPHTSP